MIVQETTNAGGVTIRIHDDYFRGKSDDDIKRVLERIAARAQADLSGCVTQPTPQRD